MRKDTFSRLFVAVGLMALSFSITSCDDDDDNNYNHIETPEAIMQKAYGDYTGTMTTSPLAAQDSEGAAGEGHEIAATVMNDTVCFDSIPVKDIVLAIIPDEATADMIVKAVGPVAYRIGYTATLNQAQDSVRMQMDTKPLTIDLAIPQEDAEPASMHIEVSVQPVDGAAYAVGSQELKFKFVATEVKLGEGEAQTPIENFPQTVFDFTLTQNKLAHH